MTDSESMPNEARVPIAKAASPLPTELVRGSETSVADAVVGSAQAQEGPEIVIGLVVAAGTAVDQVIEALTRRLDEFGYQSDVAHISRELIEPAIGLETPSSNGETAGFTRIWKLMNWGNELRRRSKDSGFLANGAASLIFHKRPKNADQEAMFRPRHAYIVSSLKHPEEVHRFRALYPNGFVALGIYSSEDERRKYLSSTRGITSLEAERIIERDKEESDSFGQQMTKTFHLSDFFVNIDDGKTSLENGLDRVLQLLFSNPFVTPTFGEYSMYLAYAASLRSADLSRQVGAVVARDGEVIATGANDAPRAGGGLYWMNRHPDSGVYYDMPKGRDYMRGYESNRREVNDIIGNVVSDASQKLADGLRNSLQKGVSMDDVSRTVAEILRTLLKKSPLASLTEFGRSVHAEMDALMACARNGVSARGATLYCTTYPCHNCTKHIIAAGIQRVVYIEPYTKSKAVKLHSDSMVEGFSDDKSVVRFQPFVGVGPRKFIDLFSLTLGDGEILERKKDDGVSAAEWIAKGALPRVKMLPQSYLDAEEAASHVWASKLTKMGVISKTGVTQ